MGRRPFFAQLLLLAAVVAGAGCGLAAETTLPAAGASKRQAPGALLAGESMAISYSGFRPGQHPDRGSGASNPSAHEVLEDLEVLVRHGFRLIRVYDSGDNTRTTLELIQKHDLPLQVLLGIWLDAELSNHDGCPWLEQPIPAATLVANAIRNDADVERGIELARRFSDIVVAVNVGNEALVDWTDHAVPLDRVIAYVRRVRSAVDQPVTVAENYHWWAQKGTRLAAEVDFLGVHTYPVWEEKTIDQALAYTMENIESVRAALPGKPIAVLEAGWPTTASEFEDRANATNQARHYAELRQWADSTSTTVFWFAAFDEPWKGDPDDPRGAEKHWGLFYVDRTPKEAMQRWQK